MELLLPGHTNTHAKLKFSRLSIPDPVKSVDTVTVKIINENYLYTKVSDPIAWQWSDIHERF